MPLYNKEEFVADAVASVVAQCCGSWNLFIVADGSTDRSIAAVGQFDDPRITVIRQSNAGPGIARNTGIAAGRAEWIAFLDADDVWLEDHLLVLDGLRTRFGEAALLGAGFHYWRGGPRPPSSRHQHATERPMRYFRESADGQVRFFTSSAACSRRAVEQVGGMKPYPQGEDTELWARLALVGPVVISTRQTALYRIDTGGITDTLAARPQPGIKSASDLYDVCLPAGSMGESLDTVTDPELRQDIADYIDAEVSAALIHSLRRGETDYARSLLRLFRTGPRGPARLAATLARLPAPVGQRLLNLSLWAKRTTRNWLRPDRS